MGEKTFDTPKPLELIDKMLKMITYDDKEAIILDFFSGAATTAHAVMNYNLQDNGKRKFIMVQLPEKTAENSEARANGYDNICEIGKERIKKAGDKILKDNPKTNIDVGFKVFKVADTNIKWNTLIEDGQLDLSQIENTPDLVDFMPNSRDIDIVYELILETKITEELISKLSELNPLPIKFIFRDSAFKDDISLKDETFRRLKALIEKNAGTNKPAYTVEFI